MAYLEKIREVTKTRRSDFKVKGWHKYSMIDHTCTIALWEVAPARLLDLAPVVLVDGYVTTRVTSQAVYTGTLGVKDG